MIRKQRGTGCFQPVSLRGIGFQPVSGLCAVLATAALVLMGCDAAVEQSTDSTPAVNRPVAVQVLTATRMSLPRSTTQPATVHPLHEAKIFAKASGYLTDLRVDIGQTVKAGELLVEIGIPEMLKRREASLAAIRQMEADQRRVAAELSVTKSRTKSFEARLGRAKAEVGKADADLAAARVELERVTDLVAQKAVADRLLDEARKKHDAMKAGLVAVQAGVTSAQAELALAIAQTQAAEADMDVSKAVTDVKRRQLEELEELIKYGQLKAPFDGIISQRNVDVGDLVRDAQTGSTRDGEPLLVLTSLKTVRIRVYVPERDATLATVGDPCTITFQAVPGNVFEGTISRTAGVLDEHTRTMLVEIDLPNNDNHLRPGMFGQATIQLAPPEETLTLPAQAVRHDGQGSSFVYVVNKASEIEIAKVKTGMDDGKLIEITGGLQGDERIVAPMIGRLQSNQKVTVKG